MRRRKVLTSGIALTSMGIIPSSSAARLSEDQNHEYQGMEYLGQDKNKWYYQFEQNDERKLNIIEKDTRKVYVKEYSNEILDGVIKKPHGKRRSNDIPKRRGKKAYRKTSQMIMMMNEDWFMIPMLKTKKLT
ncbi:hypothetical protein [Natrinema longum]|uniref:Uncharacterized protein n=1 Tax=Natrinema longum TaxID=370324 RepID=A0A8A2U5W8_9EURY|nr:hypothetical protein [Natrinema longum]MBZ6494653.1 hypothetical protein [Natrinema longum]QSW84033.1 hypothetical protein J0X27_11235 [Natrinema longum]